VSFCSSVRAASVSDRRAVVVHREKNSSRSCLTSTTTSILTAHGAADTDPWLQWAKVDTATLLPVCRDVMVITQTSRLDVTAGIIVIF